MYIQKSINEHFYTDELLQNEHTFVTTTWIQMTAPPRLPCVLSLSMNYCFWCWDKRYWLAFEFSRNRIIYITPPPSQLLLYCIGFMRYFLFCVALILSLSLRFWIPSLYECTTVYFSLPLPVDIWGMCSLGLFK